ncbi:MAG: hypothetical protein C3F15_16150 [Holophagae bacterium]|nr:MAG: hypothetical protein C3F15_16150 [Holophagae bacterium]
MKSPRLVCRLVALLGIGAGVLTAPAIAQDCPELVGHWPYGPATAVAVSGDNAYVGSGRTLLIADVSDPSAPGLVGEVTFPGDVADVAVSGSYAYVAAGGLYVIDVSTPSAPVVVGDYSTLGTAVAVAGDYAYVVGVGLGLYTFLEVIDVSTPSAPIEVGWVETTCGWADVAVSGSYAYVVGWGGLNVIDVSTPTAPVVVGSLDGIDGRAVAVAGSLAYVAGYAGLAVIDVSTPSAPVEVGSVETPGRAQGVAVSGDDAYVAWGIEGLREGGLSAIDVSSPSAPVDNSYVSTPDWASAVAVSGGYAFVAAQEASLQVIDVSPLSDFHWVGFLNTPRYSGGVAVSDGYAYVVGEGLSVIDVSAFWAPVEVGFVRAGDPIVTASSVAVEGGYAYVITKDIESHSGLWVIDVSTPSAPVGVGFLGLGGAQGAGDVAVSGSHAYVAGGYAGLRIIDVSSPSAPVEVGFVDTPGYAQGVAVSGSHAYVADGGAGVRVIDVSTSSTPVEVGFVETPGEADGVAVSGRYAYVVGHRWEGTAWRGCLRVIDVHTPSDPVEVGIVDKGGEDVALSGDYAYVAEWPTYLRVIDVTMPSAPGEVGFYEAPLLWGVPEPESVGVAVSDGHVYFAAWDAGLDVFSECTGWGWDARKSIIPAAAVAAGAQGSFFQTDVEVNNTGAEEAQVAFQWLPRGEDNSQPAMSDIYTLYAGASLRFENVLTEVFGLGPDSLGALRMVAGTESVIGMSRTYNSPEGETAGTFGQGLPAIRETDMIMRTQLRRIIFLSENEDFRANVGCINGSSEPVTINITVFDNEGSLLTTRYMTLPPDSNDQINQIFEDYAPVNGYVDVWADSPNALYYCYGSMLDNSTSDPTTILPQVPSDDTTFIPAAALAAGLEGSFFQTDVDLNNVGSTDLTYELLWLPRGADNTDPVRSDTFSLAPGAGVRYANVLDEVFGLEPDQVGSLAVEASGVDLLAMSRTYNLPSAKVAGTFGQELPGIPQDRMIPPGEKRRIIFMNENDDVRANVGCQNGASHETVRVFIELFNSAGESLETKTMDLPPYSNNQINRVFRNHSPIEAGYVDVWTTATGASIYCYGSVLDNLTSDATTVLPQ